MDAAGGVAVPEREPYRHDPAGDRRADPAQDDTHRPEGVYRDRGVRQARHMIQGALRYLLAMETAALIMCVGIGIMIDEWREIGLEHIGEGLVVWLFGQMMILPVLVLSLPIALPLRAVAGTREAALRLVALLYGAFVGCALWITLLVLFRDEFLLDAAPLFAICIVSGSIGGWTWWRLEKHAGDE